MRFERSHTKYAPATPPEMPAEPWTFWEKVGVAIAILLVLLGVFFLGAMYALNNLTN